MKAYTKQSALKSIAGLVATIVGAGIFVLVPKLFIGNGKLSDYAYGELGMINFIGMFCAFCGALIVMRISSKINSKLKLKEKVILEELGLPGVDDDYRLSLSDLQSARGHISKIRESFSKGMAVDERLFEEDSLRRFLEGVIDFDNVRYIRKRVKKLQADLKSIADTINNPKHLAEMIRPAKFSTRRNSCEWSFKAQEVFVAYVDSFPDSYLDDKLVLEIASRAAQKIEEEIRDRIRFLEGCMQLDS